MRCAIVSDIHANLQAWNAVVLDLRSRGADRILCLGDIVGYGPDPGAVLRSVHSTVDYMVMGNHDAAVCGVIDAELFNDEAKAIIGWTRGKLNRTAMRFLRSLPLSIESDFFRCTHGHFANPVGFNYVLSPEDAMACWSVVGNQLLLVGHAHEPALFVLGESGIPHAVEPQDFEVEDGKRYLVSVGSVGNPREGSALASYCMFDTEDMSVRWYKVPFDLDAYRHRLEEEGVTGATSSFLEHDPRNGKQPVRQAEDFSPSGAADKSAHKAVEVRKVNDLERRVTMWKTALSVFLVVGLIAAAVGWSRWQAYANRAVDIDDPLKGPVMGSALLSGDNGLLIPEIPTVPGDAIHGWSIHLDDKRKQSVNLAIEDGAPVFRLKSESSTDAITLTSPMVSVSEGMKFCAEAYFKKSADFSGSAVMVISLARKSGTTVEMVDQFIVKEPVKGLNQGEWLMAKKTFTVPSKGHWLTFGLRGKFKGEVHVARTALTRRDASEKDE